MLRLSRNNDVVNLLYTESNNLEVYLKKKKFIRQNLHWSGRLKMKLSCMWPMMINDFSTTPPHCPRIELTESNHILHKGTKVYLLTIHQTFFFNFFIAFTDFWFHCRCKLCMWQIKVRLIDRCLMWKAKTLPFGNFLRLWENSSKNPPMWLFFIISKHKLWSFKTSKSQPEENCPTQAKVYNLTKPEGGNTSIRWRESK